MLVPSLERFEDIEAWKKARELTRLIYQVTQIGEFRRDFGLRDQLRRASVSIMSNIAEGFERGGDKEFTQFLALAKASAGEVRSQHSALRRSRREVHRRHSICVPQRIIP